MVQNDAQDLPSSGHPREAVMDPILVFLGVSTGHSAVHRLFGEWTSCLGVPLTLKGQDVPLGAPPAAYRRLVEEWRPATSRVQGVLVTSHKTALFDAAADLVDEITPDARRLREIGLIYRRGSRLIADAADSEANQHVARRLLGGSPTWKQGDKTAIVLGGGGAGVALTYSLAHARDLECSSVTVAESNPRRAETVRDLVRTWQATVPIAIATVGSSADEIVGSAGPGSLIANATGLGKDRPGSPVTADVRFPLGSFVWDFNYRFVRQDSPTFLETASAQAAERGLTIEDGWHYFVLGWLVVMSRVVGVDARGCSECFSRAAAAIRST
jgi:shikimate 5-dehydrogenase